MLQLTDFTHIQQIPCTIYTHFLSMDLFMILYCFHVTSQLLKPGMTTDQTTHLVLLSCFFSFSFFLFLSFSFFLFLSPFLSFSLSVRGSTLNSSNSFILPRKRYGISKRYQNIIGLQMNYFYASVTNQFTCLFYGLKLACLQYFQEDLGMEQVFLIWWLGNITDLLCE